MIKFNLSHWNPHFYKLLLSNAHYIWSDVRLYYAIVGIKLVSLIVKLIRNEKYNKTLKKNTGSQPGFVL